MSLFVAILVGFLSIMAPGFFIALALLKKTKFTLFEIAIIGFILGMIIPPMFVWLESYLIPVSSVFAFSSGLYNANVIVLTIVGIVFSIQQGAFKDISLNGLLNPAKVPASSSLREMESDYKKRLSEIRSTMQKLRVDLKVMRQHEEEERDLSRRHEEEMEALKDAGPEERNAVMSSHRNQERKLYEQHEHEESMLLQSATASSSGAAVKTQFNKRWLLYLFIIGLMAVTFVTRFSNIDVAPRYFEFDPYFDMVSTQYILTYGYQLYLDTSAWPTAVNGTNHRAEPLIPYIEAYWYDVAGPQAQNTLAGPVPSSLGPAVPLTSGPASTETPPNTNLISLVSSYYPPIAAALLVFVVFMLLYHLYGDFPAIVGAVLATAMPTLISTFIAGEQLLEPFGILLLFFFLGTYLLAVENPREPRYAILAGLAFAANFLGAQYYTVPAAVLAVYILAQGLFNVIKNKEMRDFYKMNIIVIAVFTVLFILYIPYAATLQNRIPSYFGVPTIISFPVAALLIVALFQYLPVLLNKFKIASLKLNSRLYLLWLVLLAIVIISLILATPLGKPVKAYLSLSSHFTTPSTPLFMTVQEYAPTGLNFDFGLNGFGIIAASIGGLQIILWIVMIAFVSIELYAIFFKNSQSGIMVLAFTLPLAFAGLSEVKYLPHFGVAYIIAICVIFGELMIYLRGKEGPEWHTWAVYAVGAIIIIAEFVGSIGLGVLPAALNQNCTTINNTGNQVGADLFCNTVPVYWLNALAWMRENIGPSGPRVMSWWDYGDWINWFGNTNTVIRGDNAVPTLDYAVAARYVLGNASGFGPANLATFMNTMQSKYVVFDNQLVPKWGALDFLACIDTNQTSQAYAEKQGKLYNQSFILGTSPCEVAHDPAELLVPANVSSVSDFCSISNSSANESLLRTITIIGQSATNESYCLPTSFLQSGAPTRLIYSNGTKSNAVVTTQLFQGEFNSGGTPFYTFILIYLPNGPNDTITNAPSQFYNSNYYRGFFLGKLPGFTLAYPSNFTGINYVNSTSNIMIYSLDNFTGTLPKVLPKPSYVNNSYVMPG